MKHTWNPEYLYTSQMSLRNLHLTSLEGLPVTRDLVSLYLQDNNIVSLRHLGQQVPTP